jgi:hypothetical protein
VSALCPGTCEDKMLEVQAWILLWACGHPHLPAASWSQTVPLWWGSDCEPFGAQFLHL